MQKGKQILLAFVALSLVSAVALAAPPVFKEFRHGEQKSLGAQDRIAPLAIRTSPGENYFVKLVDAVRGTPVMYMMIEGGRPFETLVPLGMYRIRYAAGKQWMNSSDLFGEQTLTSEADQNFNFRRTADGISGYQIELILQRSGNLHTKVIPRAQF